MMPFPNSCPVPLILLKETDSTNRYLNDLCDKECVNELTTAVANFQNSGRGQRGNSWESEKDKNLLFSVVFYPSFIEARKQFVLSQIVSLSIKDELDVYCEHFSIKWPNDIYWKEKKICGILIVNNLTDSCISRSIAGIGININQEEFLSPAPNPVSLKQITGLDVPPLHLLSCIMKRMKRYYTLLQEGKAEWIAAQYQNALFRKQGMHRYSDEHGTFLAEIVRVEAEGKLILRDENGKERDYAFKEVQYLL